MTTENFNTLQKYYLDSKAKFDKKLRSLVENKKEFKKEDLNGLVSMATKFHTEFESFLTEISSEKYNLTKIQIQDVLTSIKNILEASIVYWDTVGMFPEEMIGEKIKPQNGFLKTAQAILKTYDKKEYEKIKDKFLEKGLPTEGFDTKEKYKLNSSKVDWVLVCFGVLFLCVSGFIVFVDFIETGMQYLLTRIFIALGVAFLLTGFTKSMIQAKIKIPSITILATNTIAIFFILYFFNPAEEPKYEKMNNNINENISR
ncbi:hypothetical protein [Aliarcobacter cryaerophilus]|uniref:hypothetical protein n=1 Tax=Aliarcobacter cryaerophilus TaxID=28198 RepID=UPI0021B314F5|nr:hypothetical protein [Aliarcobacter cryaerophilus]MCT7445515.1 hypothetical protein [Aliarcobacter cryaerophilus]MCT7480421.1 hypothetical protein [Aliarcobacter cryaerophilus]